MLLKLALGLAAVGIMRQQMLGSSLTFDRKAGT